MHTKVIRQREKGGAVADGDIRVHHNGGWDGSAELQWSEGVNVHRVTVPGWVAEVLAYDAAVASPSAKLAPVQLADYIVAWLESRNAGELGEALEAMSVASFRLMHEELALILKHGGHPPNWVPVAAPTRGTLT